MTAIADASALIALAQIELLDRLFPLFDECVIPAAVAREIAPSVIRPPWIVERALIHEIDSQISQADLDPGDTEALALAIELPGHVVILDDLPARRLAISLRISIVGTLGVLVGAKRAGLIPDVRSPIEILLDHDFRASPSLVRRIMSLAGE